MAKITADHKEEMSNSEFIPEGIHKVKIMEVNNDKTQNDKEFIEFTVVDDQEREGKARMWLSSDPAIKYTFNMLRTIFVHNAPSGKKDEIRDAINALDSTENLVKACKQLIGKEAWFQVSKSDRTYQNDKGETKNSYDKNLYGYEPTPKKVTPVESTPDSTEPLKTTDSEGNEQLIAEF